MGASNSTPRHARRKPDKPRPDFPLFPHNNGLWAKKIKGKLHYFGPWADPDKALETYLDQKDDLYAGRVPGKRRGVLTIRDLVNRFLTRKKQQADLNEITPRLVRDYKYTTDRVVNVFGLTRAVEDLGPADFERLLGVMAETMGPTTRTTEIRKTRAVFKYAYDCELIEKPIKYGPAFSPPPQRVLKKARRQNGLKMFERDELRAVLDEAGAAFKAMVLLGVNCGFGNHDCSTLTFAALDLEGGWHNHARPKTGAERRCPLWPETVEAIKKAIAKRREPLDPADSELVFITQYGRRYVRFQPMAKPDPKDPTKGVWFDGVSMVAREVLRRAGVKRPGLSFYALRHTFETIAGETADQVAVDYIMGHLRGDMASVYREWISDDRLRRVTDHVHAWLFPPDQKQ